MDHFPNVGELHPEFSASIFQVGTHSSGSFWMAGLTLKKQLVVQLVQLPSGNDSQFANWKIRMSYRCSTYQNSDVPVREL